MLNGLCSKPKELVTAKSAKAGIDTLIYVKHSLELANTLSGVLDNFSGAQSSIVNASISTLRNVSFSKILFDIASLLSESTSYSKSVHEMRHQECFAIQSNVNNFLDVARVTFLQTVEDIYSLADTYEMSLGVEVKVSHSSTRGYYLQISYHEGMILPNIFVQV
jgi:DNA mismatch repair protein MSH4